MAHFSVRGGELALPLLELLPRRATFGRRCITIDEDTQVSTRMGVRSHPVALDPMSVSLRWQGTCCRRSTMIPKSRALPVAVLLGVLSFRCAPEGEVRFTPEADAVVLDRLEGTWESPDGTVRLALCDDPREEAPIPACGGASHVIHRGSQPATADTSEGRGCGGCYPSPAAVHVAGQAVGPWGQLRLAFAGSLGTFDGDRDYTRLPYALTTATSADRGDAGSGPGNIRSWALRLTEGDAMTLERVLGSCDACTARYPLHRVDSTCAHAAWEADASTGDAGVVDSATGDSDVGDAMPPDASGARDR